MLLPRFSLKQVDRGWGVLRKAARTVRDGDSTVKVGVIGETGRKGAAGDALNNVELATVHEFGTATVPERSFIRSTYEAHRDEMVLLMARLVPALYAQKITVQQLLGLVGAKFAAEIKNTIRASIPPPLSPVTIAEKGSSLPLVDTGQLINSISWVVEKAK
jgi:hypothetical protein